MKDGWDANKVEPLGDLSAIPAGKYIAMIRKSEMKATKKGDGSYLELQFTITDGEHKGHPLWTRLNLKNPNPQAVEIAERELSAICRAVNCMAPKDSVELHNLPMIVKVKQKVDASGEIRNEISDYEPRVSAGPAAAVNPTAPAATTVPATTGEKKDENAPW